MNIKTPLKIIGNDFCHYKERSYYWMSQRVKVLLVRRGTKDCKACFYWSGNLSPLQSMKLMRSGTACAVHYADTQIQLRMNGVFTY